MSKKKRNRDEKLHKKLQSQKKKHKRAVNAAIAGLAVVYNDIPDTKGCLDHIGKPKCDGGCGGWCCEFQSPSTLYVEFLHTWKYVLENWSFDDIADLVESAMKAYVSDRPTKGCIFWDSETKLCRQHETRPLACRVYGITPKEEFEPRIARLRVLYADQPDAVLRDQCSLVSTTDGRDVTVEDTSRWWNQLKQLEVDAGIPANRINDEPQGSYRTYHDHLLLQVCPDSVMGHLQTLRLYGEPAEKEVAIKSFMVKFRDSLSQWVQQRDDESDS